MIDVQDSLGTSRGIGLFIEKMLWMIRTNFERDGVLYPVAAVIVSRDPLTKTPLETPKVMFVGCAAASLAEKEPMAERIRSIAKAGAAIGVLFATEAWMVKGSVGDGLETYTDSLSKHPARQETIFVSLEHVAFDSPRCWMAEIRRDPENHPTLLPFEEPWNDATEKPEMRGRFTMFLPNLEYKGKN